MIAPAPLLLLAFALLVAALKGRFVAAAITVAVWAGLTFIAHAVIGTAVAADAPLSDAWIVVLLQLAGWVPAVTAGAGAAAPNSWWVRRGRRAEATPLRVVAGNFAWVLAIVFLGILFAGVDILGAQIFCAAFAILLAGMLLFGFGSAKTQMA